MQNRLWQIWREDEGRIGFKILHNFHMGNIKMDENNGAEILDEYFQVKFTFLFRNNFLISSWTLIWRNFTKFGPQNVLILHNF